MNNAYLAKAKQMIPDPQILSVVAAKRARQLAGGGRPMVKLSAEDSKEGCVNLLDVALKEIGEGLLEYEFVEASAEVPAEAAEIAEAAAEGEKVEETPSW